MSSGAECRKWRRYWVGGYCDADVNDPVRAPGATWVQHSGSWNFADFSYPSAFRRGIHIDAPRSTGGGGLQGKTAVGFRMVHSSVKPPEAKTDGQLQFATQAKPGGRSA